MPAKFLKSVVNAADIPETNRPQIAMVGRSNVGKSSLINHLAGAKNLARTSSEPGLTQTINLYEFDGRYLLVDLPGYGFHRAKRAKSEGFGPMIADYLSNADRLKLVLLIVDARLGLTDRDHYVLRQLQEQEIPLVVIVNKVDKISNSDVTLALRRLKTEYPGVEFIPHSTVTGKGLGEIRDAIERTVRAHGVKP
ncbi:MAG: ribosome biogenesis GTP-binding protein YihA/YsxC [Patescibacteria group bacterium]|nr:ribosome biogenesis GTP-binding protein YihA/YsxC [Patescibacteria group bacterium]